MADPEIKKIALIFKFIQVFCEMLKKSKLEWFLFEFSDGLVR